MPDYTKASEHAPAGTIGPDQIKFHAHLSDDRTLCFFDITKPDGPVVRLEFPREELVNVITTLCAMAQRMPGGEFGVRRGGRRG